MLHLCGLSSSSAGALASPSERGGDGQPFALPCPVVALATLTLLSWQDMTSPKLVLQSLESFLVAEDGLTHCQQ